MLLLVPFKFMAFKIESNWFAVVVFGVEHVIASMERVNIIYEGELEY